jgi:hypothetical protein
MARKFEGFGIDEIDVRGGDCKNYTVWLCDILGDEVSRLLFDIRRLVANGNLRHEISILTNSRGWSIKPWSDQANPPALSSRHVESIS